MKLSTFHRRLATTRRGRHIAAASCALAFAAGYSGRAHSRSTSGQKGSSNASATRSHVPPAHVMPTADGSPGKLFRLQGVRVNSKLENGRLIVNGLTGAMAGGRVNASGRIDVGDKQGAQSVRAQFDDVDLREVLRLLDVNLDSAGLSGVRADGIVNVNWRGTDRDLVRQSLSGSATIKTGPGRISKDSPLLKKLGNAAGISDLDGLSFRSARIEASADRGVLNIRSLVFQGDEFRLASAGVVNVRDSKINLLLDLDVTQALAERSKYYKLQGLASLFGKEGMETTEDGFVEVPRIALAGKLSEPDVKMDTGARSANRNEESVAKHSAPAKKPAEVEVEPVEEPSDSAREVAKQDAETETKRVPLWRDVLSSLTEEKK